MLATWNVLNMQHNPNSKKGDYSDIPGGGQNGRRDPESRDTSIADRLSSYS